MLHWTALNCDFLQFLKIAQQGVAPEKPASVSLRCTTAVFPVNLGVRHFTGVIYMLRVFIAGICIMAVSVQAVAQQVVFQPALRAQVNFGGSAKSQSFSAHLSLLSVAEQQISTNHQYIQQPRSISHLTFNSSQLQGSELLALGSPVMSWGQPQHAEFVLNQNEQNAKSGSWFSRNWWVVGLGVLAVGAAAAAGGGGGSDNNSSGNSGNQTNCGVAGTVVGPGGVTTDPNCRT
jgi:hypothetical protein